jgi:hypothetical protein
MSATLLAFAKPLLDQVEDPPTATTLQNVLNIAMVVWNLPLYEKAKHANAAMLRTGLESALGQMPPEVGALSQPWRKQGSRPLRKTQGLSSLKSSLIAAARPR